MSNDRHIRYMYVSTILGLKIMLRHEDVHCKNKLYTIKITTATAINEEQHEASRKKVIICVIISVVIITLF